MHRRARCTVTRARALSRMGLAHAVLIVGASLSLAQEGEIVGIKAVVFPAIVYAGEHAQIQVTGIRANGTTVDLTQGASGTQYVVGGTNAQVDANGRLTAVERVQPMGYSEVVVVAHGVHTAVVPVRIENAGNTDPVRLGSGCVVGALNRAVEVAANGRWVLPGVPSNVGPTRIRATCKVRGRARSGASSPILIPGNTTVAGVPIFFE